MGRDPDRVRLPESKDAGLNPAKDVILFQLDGSLPYTLATPEISASLDVAPGAPSGLVMGNLFMRLSFRPVVFGCAGFPDDRCHS
jgi:hypothetical protein